MTHACSCGHDATALDVRDPAPRITAEHTVAEVSRDPRALEILKAMGVDHCCGAHLPLAEAAAAAGVPLAMLLQALGAAVGAPSWRASPMPGALAGVDEAHRVVIDVRDDIRHGEEPFARIMAAVTALARDQVLVLRAPFEPVPLYDVLGRRGLRHWTDRRGADDWMVWF